MKKNTDYEKLQNHYPLLKKHIAVRVNKGRCIVSNHRTGTAYLENPENFVLLSLCDGTKKLAEVLELHKNIFSVSSNKDDTQLKDFFTKNGSIIDYYENKQAKRAVFHPAHLKNIDTWQYSPLRDEYPHKLTIVLTECCNHTCDYCFKSCDSSKKPELKVSDWMRVIEQAHDIGVQEITFTGGEPFLYKDFLSLIAHCTKRGIYTRISTNGTLLDKNTIRDLKHAGAEYIHLSLPAISEPAYDKITGSKKDLEKVVEAVRQLKHHGFYIRAKMVLTPNNVEEVDKLIDFCAAEGIDFLHLAPYILTENSRFGRQLILAEDSLLKIKNIAEEKQKQYKNIVISDIPLSSLKWQDQQCITKCGGIKDSLTILSNGDITFCEALGNLKEFILGNVCTHTLSEIWFSPNPDNITCPDGKNLEPSCLACEYLNQCQTGCFVFSHMQSKNPWSMDPRCFRFQGTQNIFTL